MEQFNLAEILQDVDGRNELLQAAQNLGLLTDVSPSTSSKVVIDFGRNPISSLATDDIDIPLGYEGCGSGMASLTGTISFSNSNNYGSSASTFFIKDYLVLPSYNLGTPRFTIAPESGEYGFALSTVVCRPGEVIKLKVKVQVPISYRGSLNRFIVFLVECQSNPSRVSIQNTVFLCAIQITGVITKDITTLDLSTCEAAPFIPLSVLQYFDTPVVRELLYVIVLILIVLL